MNKSVKIVLLYFFMALLYSLCFYSVADAQVYLRYLRMDTIATDVIKLDSIGIPATPQGDTVIFFCRGLDGCFLLYSDGTMDTIGVTGGGGGGVVDSGNFAKLNDANTFGADQTISGSNDLIVGDTANISRLVINDFALFSPDVTMSSDLSVADTVLAVQFVGGGGGLTGVIADSLSGFTDEWVNQDVKNTASPTFAGIEIDAGGGSNTVLDGNGAGDLTTANGTLGYQYDSSGVSGHSDVADSSGIADSLSGYWINQNLNTTADAEFLSINLTGVAPQFYINETFKLPIIGDGEFTYLDNLVTGNYILQNSTGVLSWSATPSLTSLTLSGNLTANDAFITDTVSCEDLVVDQLSTFGSDVTMNSDLSVADSIYSPYVHISNNLTVDDSMAIDGTTLVVSPTNDRVGIGTATPDSTLKVTGSGRFTTNLQVDNRISNPHTVYSMGSSLTTYDSDISTGLNMWNVGNAMLIPTVVSVDYYSGGWTTWTGGDTEVKEMLEDNLNTHCNVDYDHRKFRFVLSGMAWRQLRGFVMMRGYTAYLERNFTFTYETSTDNITYTTRYTVTTNQSGEQIMLPINYSSGEGYWRITFDISLGAGESWNISALKGLANRGSHPYIPSYFGRDYTGFFIGTTPYPTTTAVYDLGTSSYNFRDAYLSRNLILGSAGYIKTSGVSGNPGSPAVGDYWYNTTQKSHRFYSTAGTQGLVGTIYSNTAVSSTVTGTSSETNYDLNYTLPANALTAGKRLRIRCGGYFTCGNTYTMIWRIKMGSNTVLQCATYTATAGDTNAPFWFEGDVYVFTAGSSGTGRANGSSVIGMSPSAWANRSGALTINTTTSHTLQVSVQSTSTFASSILECLSIEVLD